MTRTKRLIVGMLVLSLLAFGIVALAANGFGKGGSPDQAGAELGRIFRSATRTETGS